MTHLLYRWFHSYDSAVGAQKRLIALTFWLAHIFLIFGGIVANNLLVVLMLWVILVWGWHLRWEYKTSSTTITTVGSQYLRVGDVVKITSDNSTEAFIVVGVDSNTTVTVVPK